MGQNKGPGALDHRVDGHPVGSGELGQRGGDLLVLREVDPLGRRGEGAAVRRHDARGVEPGERLRPGVLGGVPVTGAQPGEVVAVGADPGQRRHIAVGGVQQHHLAQEHRHGPAVEQDVMVRHHQPVTACSQPDQRVADQRRPGHVEPLPAVLGGEPLRDGFPFRLRQGTQVLLAPGRRHLARNELHRACQPLVAEGRAQVRVPLEQRHGDLPEPGRVHLPLQLDEDLDVVRVQLLVVEEVVEQHSLLQRGERKNVFQSGLGHQKEPHSLSSRAMSSSLSEVRETSDGVRPLASGLRACSTRSSSALNHPSPSCRTASSDSSAVA